MGPHRGVHSEADNVTPAVLVVSEGKVHLTQRPLAVGLRLYSVFRRNNGNHGCVHCVHTHGSHQH